MGRLTDTEQMRIYFTNKIGGIFDYSYDSNHIFKEIPSDNLRQYITRFVKEGVLRKISKGIYAIGKSTSSDKERIIKHYTSCSDGVIGGDYLLYQLGIVENEPEKVVVLTRATIGNKIIKKENIELISTRSIFTRFDHTIDIIKAIEIIAHSSINNASAIAVLTNLLKGYTDRAFRENIGIIYKRIVYIRLANILNTMGISNMVMDIYANKTNV